MPILDGASIQAQRFEYRRSADQDRAEPARHPVVVVGAGPVGLSLAIDLAQRGQPVLLLDNDDRLSHGSRAICFAKRTLEIWDRLGIGQECVDKGVSWHVGRVFLGEQQVYAFDLLPETGHQRPAFVNLQQYYAEAFLLRRALQLPALQLRWKNQVAALEMLADGGVRLGIDTSEGRYQVDADHAVACDGAQSVMRRLLGEKSQGRSFQDRFLIADVKMAVDFPAERWFWFDPPFHRHQSVLLHRQPDDVWRIDFQLGWDADPEAEKEPGRIRARIDAMMRQALGHEVPYQLEWASVYTFACLRMPHFRHGAVLFAGDSAHGVSPFGARGANSGVQDADNLGWKLAAMLAGRAPSALLDSYAAEREAAADENILNSTRSTDFITPKSAASRVLRDATLQLARHHAFARKLVNSGRLSLPSTHRDSPLNTPDRDTFAGAMVPGAPATDAALRCDGEDSWLLRQTGDDFVLIVYGEEPAAASHGVAPLVLHITPQGMQQPGRWCDRDGAFAQRYDARPGSAWLLRPDQHVCARWRQATAQDVTAALQRALGHPTKDTR